MTISTVSTATPMTTTMTTTDRAFPCRRCGGSMRVMETRANTSGIRRRRYCVDAFCNARMTTQEIPIWDTGDVHPGGRRGVAGRDLVLVPRHLLTRLLSVARDFESILPADGLDAPSAPTVSPTGDAS